MVSSSGLDPVDQTIPLPPELGKVFGDMYPYGTFDHNADVDLLTTSQFETVQSHQLESRICMVAEGTAKSKMCGLRPQPHTLTEKTVTIESMPMTVNHVDGLTSQVGILGANQTQTTTTLPWPPVLATTITLSATTTIPQPGVTQLPSVEATTQALSEQAVASSESAVGNTTIVTAPEESAAPPELSWQRGFALGAGSVDHTSDFRPSKNEASHLSAHPVHTNHAPSQEDSETDQKSSSGHQAGELRQQQMATPYRGPIPIIMTRNDSCVQRQVTDPHLITEAHPTTAYPLPVLPTPGASVDLTHQFADMPLTYIMPPQFVEKTPEPVPELFEKQTTTSRKKNQWCC